MSHSVSATPVPTAPGRTKRRLAIVDCHTLAAQSLAIALQSHSEFEVVWVTHCLREAHRQFRQTPCDLMLLDVEIEQGVWCFIDRIHRSAPDVKLVILSMNGCDAFVRQALDSGVSGYVLKCESLHSVVDTLRRVEAGDRPFPEHLTARLRQDGSNGATLRNGILADALTPRQLEVLTLIARGNTAKGIARSLNLSVKGVNSHIYRIMDKLNVHNRVELARLAIREGLIAP